MNPKEYRDALNRARTHLRDLDGLPDKLRLYLDYVLDKTRNDNRLFWRTQRTLSIHFGWSLRTVQRVHSAAVRAGAIKVIYRSDQAAQQAGVNVKSNYKVHNFVSPDLSWSGYTEQGLTADQMREILGWMLVKQLPADPRSLQSGPTVPPREPHCTGVVASGAAVRKPSGAAAPPTVRRGGTRTSPRDQPSQDSFRVSSPRDETATQEGTKEQGSQEYQYLDWFLQRWQELAQHTSVKPISKTQLPEFQAYWSAEIDQVAPAVLEGLYSCPWWLGLETSDKYSNYPNRGLHPLALFTRETSTQEYIWKLLATRRRPYIYTSSLHRRVRLALDTEYAEDRVKPNLDELLRRGGIKEYEMSMAREIASGLLSQWTEPSAQPETTARSRLQQYLKVLLAPSKSEGEYVDQIWIDWQYSLMELHALLLQHSAFEITPLLSPQQLEALDRGITRDRFLKDPHPGVVRAAQSLHGLLQELLATPVILPTSSTLGPTPQPPAPTARHSTQTAEEEPDGREAKEGP